MAKGRAQTPDEPPRPLELDPERARQLDRRPYAIVDIGSNSIRLLVYDQLGRAPMPRFNEKSLARLAEGLAGDRRNRRPTIFVAQSRPCGDFAPSPRRWG